MERAIIRELRVRPGDHVTRGELIATLDPTFTEADLNILKRQIEDALAKQERLRFEVTPNGRPHFDARTPGGAAQYQLSLKREEEHRLRLAECDARLRRDAHELAFAHRRVGELENQLAIATEVAGIRQKLMRDAVNSRLQYLAAETERLNVEKERNALVDHIDEVEKDAASAENDRASSVAQWQREAMDDLVATESELARLRETLAKASRLHELIWLRAPRDGIVLDVAQRSAGSVLHEAEPLLSILPDNATMIAETSVGSRDIGNLAAGDPVLVKVDAFPYQLHGMLHGTVRSIGEESFTDMKSHEPGAVHKVRIALTSTRLWDLPKGAALIPGMTISAEVKVGARNVLAYFLYPVTRGLRESLREP
jgi:HlyD family secretion protein